MMMVRKRSMRWWTKEIHPKIEELITTYKYNTKIYFVILPNLLLIGK